MADREWGDSVEEEMAAKSTTPARLTTTGLSLGGLLPLGSPGSEGGGKSSPSASPSSTAPRERKRDILWREFPRTLWTVVLVIIVVQLLSLYNQASGSLVHTPDTSQQKSYSRHMEVRGDAPGVGVGTSVWPPASSGVKEDGSSGVLRGGGVGQHPKLPSLPKPAALPPASKGTTTTTTTTTSAPGTLPPGAIVIVFGTRPEAIKMLSVIESLRAGAGEAHPVVCINSGQHDALLDETLAGLGGAAGGVDMDLNVPSSSMGGPAELLGALTAQLGALFTASPPAVVVVQGDTTTAAAAAQAAYLAGCPVAHIEAGLRSFSGATPFPEEFYRTMISSTASLHLAPTHHAANMLVSAGNVRGRVHVVGNTGVDGTLMQVRRLGKEVWGEGGGGGASASGKDTSALRTLASLLPSTTLLPRLPSIPHLARLAAAALENTPPVEEGGIFALETPSPVGFPVYAKLCHPWCAGKSASTGETCLQASVVGEFSGAAAAAGAGAGGVEGDDSAASAAIWLVFTMHRRESFGEGMASVVSALGDLIVAHAPHLNVIWPMHPNPAVAEGMRVGLAGVENHLDTPSSSPGAHGSSASSSSSRDEVIKAHLHVVDPLPPHVVAALILASDGVITDSGGLQEEAVTLGRHVFVTRESTERPEGLGVGLMHLVGVDGGALVKSVGAWIGGRCGTRFQASVRAARTYGDGHAGERCGNLILAALDATLAGTATGWIPDGQHANNPRYAPVAGAARAATLAPPTLVKVVSADTLLPPVMSVWEPAEVLDPATFRQGVSPGAAARAARAMEKSAKIVERANAEKAGEYALMDKLTAEIAAMNGEELPHTPPTTPTAGSSSTTADAAAAAPASDAPTDAGEASAGDGGGGSPPVEVDAPPLAAQDSAPVVEQPAAVDSPPTAETIAAAPQSVRVPPPPPSSQDTTPAAAGGGGVDPPPPPPPIKPSGLKRLFGGLGGGGGKGARSLLDLGGLMSGIISSASSALSLSSTTPLAPLPYTPTTSAPEEFHRLIGASTPAVGLPGHARFMRRLQCSTQAADPGIKEETYGEIINTPSAYSLNRDGKTTGAFTWTAILGTYRRVLFLERMIEALLSQTHPPVEVWITTFSSPHEEALEAITRKFSQARVKFVSGDPQLKYFGRFQLAFQAPSTHIAFFDDDCIPGKQVVANAFHVMYTTHRRYYGLIGMKGHWGNVETPVTHNQLPYHLQWEYRPGVAKQVDLTGGLWFLRRDWLHIMFRDNAFTLETGEDFQLTYTLRKYMGLNTFLLPTDANVPDTWPHSPDYFDVAKGTESTNGRLWDMRPIIFFNMLQRGFTPVMHHETWGEHHTGTNVLVVVDHAEDARALRGYLSALGQEYAHAVRPLLVITGGPGAGRTEKDILGALGRPYTPQVCCFVGTWDLFLRKLDAQPYRASDLFTEVVVGMRGVIETVRPALIVVAHRRGSPVSRGVAEAGLEMGVPTAALLLEDWKVPGGKLSPEPWEAGGAPSVNAGAGDTYHHARPGEGGESEVGEDVGVVAERVVEEGKGVLREAQEGVFSGAIGDAVAPVVQSGWSVGNGGEATLGNPGGEVPGMGEDYVGLRPLDVHSPLDAPITSAFTYLTQSPGLLLRHTEEVLCACVKEDSMGVGAYAQCPWHVPHKPTPTPLPVPAS